MLGQGLTKLELVIYFCIRWIIFQLGPNSIDYSFNELFDIQVSRLHTILNPKMQLKYFAALTCLALAYISNVEAAVDPVSLAVIVIAGVAIAKEKLVAAEIHRQYIRKPVHSSGYGYKRG